MREIKVGDELLWHSTFSLKVFKLAIKTIRNTRADFNYVDMSDNSSGSASWVTTSFTEGLRDGSLIFLNKTVPIEDDPEYSGLFI